MNVKVAVVENRETAREREGERARKIKSLSACALALSKRSGCYRVLQYLLTVFIFDQMLPRTFISLETFLLGRIFLFQFLIKFLIFPLYFVVHLKGNFFSSYLEKHLLLLRSLDVCYELACEVCYVKFNLEDVLSFFETLDDYLPDSRNSHLAANMSRVHAVEILEKTSLVSALSVDLQPKILFIR